MRSNSRFWYRLGVLCLLAVVLCWIQGNQQIPRRNAERPAGGATNQSKSVGRNSAGSAATAPIPANPSPALAQRPAAAGTAAPAGNVAVPGPSARARFPYRLSNTDRPLSELGRSDTAILLENAFIDTAVPTALVVPAELRSKGDPGSYIVQSRRALDPAFYALLGQAGAEFISYIPNNAALVRVSAEGARRLSGLGGIRAVLPYEPYYKLAQGLLPVAMEQGSLAPDQPLNVMLFPGQQDSALAGLRDLGAVVTGQGRTPFGPVVTVTPHPDTLVELAQLAGVQRIEYAGARTLLNDLSRVRLNVAEDTVTPTNYLNLTGSNVLINLNDTGVDAGHPDLAGHVFTDTNAITLLDLDGHGTHVAGTIISSGGSSSSARDSNNALPSGSSVDSTFRGSATNASLFVLPIDLQVGPLISDSYLQETAASNNFVSLGRTNAFISNNSWGYLGRFEYNLASASYDAAVRDALPGLPGSQSILYVFAAGNSGFGNTNGLSGEADTVIAPATAKNVITVGAIESWRNITNEFYFTNVVSATNVVVTNAPFLGYTDSDNQVAVFSSRGNVGIGTEGDFGRFKPDVVAPGTFVVSTRSQQITNAIDPRIPFLGQYYRYESGTSMAAPAVSGVLALLEEFFEQRLHRSFSPALMKALLINGARSTSGKYDLGTTNNINFEGWGLANLTNSLPAPLNDSSESAWPLRFFDQDPADALATGREHTWQLSLSTNAVSLPLRVTLVWTDPPGNPGAGIKLVNDLDLVVTNLDSGEVFFGNNFPAGFDFNPPVTDTNAPAPLDFVNNVENVYLQAPLGTNYSITVTGRRVNVNAVSANTNEVVQDFALVISSGNGEVTNAFVSLNRLSDAWADRPAPIGLTNGMPLLHQRVGANFQLAPSPGGATNQWRFYVFTNAFFTNNLTGLTNGSNVAFVTFLPPDLSRPRNLDADIDLYVSKDPALTNLDAGAISTAWTSRERGGTESVVFTNALVGLDQIYYIGVKSEDQQGAEFGVVGLSTDLPFDESDGLGNRILHGMPPTVPIPDGSPDAPGAALMFAIGIHPQTIARVIVTNDISHQSVGDIIGTLSHRNQFAVLNNHNRYNDTGDTLFHLVYDDSNSGQFLLSRPTDGPGSLTDFLGEGSAGVWLLAMVDDSQGKTGRVESLTLRVEPQRLLTNGVDGAVLANQWSYYFVDVPVDASKLTVTISSNNAPLDLYVKRGAQPTATDFDKFARIDPPGGALSIGLGDVPPLNAGRYFIGIFNPNSVTVSFHLTVLLERNAANLAARTYFPTNAEPLLDDAVTGASLVVTNNRAISSVQVGVRVDHARASDLVFHLISPQGTRILLAENRGRDSAAGYGIGSGGTTNVTNVVATVMDDGFENAVDALNLPAGSYASGWHVDQGNIDVLGPGNYPVLGPPYSGTNWIDIVGNDFGVISTNIGTIPGTPYRLSFAYTRNPGSPGVPNPASASANINVNGNRLLNLVAPADNIVGNINWKTTSAVFTASTPLTKLEVAAETMSLPFAGVFFDAFKLEQLSVTTPMLYTIFTEDTNLTTTPIKFGIGPFASTNGLGTNLVFTNSFEGARPGDYCAPTNFDVWQAYSNQVTVISNAVLAHTGTNFLALDNGQALLGLPTVAGRPYQLRHVYRRNPPDPSLVSWWPGEGDANDIVSTNNGALMNGISFTNGVVGQAFNFDGVDDFVLVPASSNLNVRSITFDAWIYPVDLSQPYPLLEYAAPTGFVGAHFWINVTPFITPGTLYVNFRDAAIPGDPGNHFMSSGPNVIRTNEWQHVAATYDQATGEAKLYWNGNLVATANLGIFAPQTIYPLNFGYRPSGVSETLAGSHFRGAMDEVDVWSRALSPTEIRAIYLAQSGGKCGAQTLQFPTPISWWPAEDNANDLIDANPGTLSATGVTFAGGLVGKAFKFDGTGGVRINNNANLNVQTNLTLEAWVNPTVLDGEMDTILYKEPDNSVPEQYALAVKGPLNISCPGGTVTNGHLAFALVGVAGLPNDFCGWVDGGADVPTNQWTHVAVTYDGSTARAFVNGVLTRTITNLVGAVNVSAGPLWLGSRGPNITTPFPNERFNGLIDETAIYDHALDPCVIGDIYQANIRGKYSLRGRPAPCPVSADIILDDRLTNTVTSFDWRLWQTNFVSFAATQNATPLRLVARQPEMQFDTFELNELSSGNYFLPEESLKPLLGESALGTWTLEVWDNRVGAFINPSADLLSWELQFIFANTNPPAIPLTFVPATTNVASIYDTNGLPVTNQIVGGQVRYFIVDVPRRATLATNLLTVLSGTGDLALWYNRDGLPTGGPADVIQDTPVPGGGETLLLTTNSPLAAELRPGQRYYLGVTNKTALTTNEFFISVAFDQTDTDVISVRPLTNGICLTATIPVTNALDYYQFNVSTNAAAVSFQLSPQNGNADLVVRRALPVPDPLPWPVVGRYDYISQNLGTNVDEIDVTVNSQPVALGPGLWYLGVFNRDTNAIVYTICATESAATPYNIIRLTNDVPVDFTLTAGSPLTNFFLFTIDQTNAAVAFRLYNLNNPADLVVDQNFLPDPNSYSFLGSGGPGAPVQILVDTNGYPFELNGDWYLAVLNQSTNDLTFTILATFNTNSPPTNNIVIDPLLVITNGSVCLSWSSVVGQDYHVETKTNLNEPTWTVVSPTLTATNTTTSYCVPITGPQAFFRVVLGSASPAPFISFSNLALTQAGFVLNWTAPATDQFQVQYATNLPPAWTTFSNIVTSATGNFTFTDDGTQSGGLSAMRFYRLLLLP